MSTQVIDECFGFTDVELDDEIRRVELETRRLQDRRSSLLALAESRRLHEAHDHRSIAGYLRATCNWSKGQITTQRKLARLVDAVPEVGDALAAGYIGVDQALQIARIHSNRRISHLTARIAPTLLEQAEHLPYVDFVLCVDRFVMLADIEGSFADVAADVEHRTALVTAVGGALHVQASGGDPLTAASMISIFERFVEREFRNDVAARRAEFGDQADRYPLPRSAAQRSFDALQTIFELAADAGDVAASTPEPLVNIVCDERTLDEAFARAGLTLPNGQQLDVDEFGQLDIDAFVADIAGDPAHLLDRRCETTAGTVVHPMLVLQAAITGHIRRVVVDSTGVVTGFGRQQRLFTGSVRIAAKLLAQRCSHPGCDVSATFAEVDHIEPWAEGGRTDLRNADIRCGRHNRFKHRERWRTRRDPNGRKYSVRPDGTIVLPVGERPPDLSIDELEQIARARLAALVDATPPAARTSS